MNSRPGTYNSRTVWIALAANLGIFSIKSIAAFLSNSAAMFSEALHSLTDTVNSVLLLIGIRLAGRPADETHPFGYGKEVYFWSLAASMFMFGVTSMGSIYRGYEQLIHPRPLGKTTVSLIILLVAILFESSAVFSAMKAVLNDTGVAAKGLRIIPGSIRNLPMVANPTVKFVFFEDSAALSGATLAMIAIIISEITGQFTIDAYISIIIGVALAILAIILAIENKEMIIGRSASERLEQVIGNTALTVSAVRDVHSLKTMHMGPRNLLVNMEIEVQPDLQVERMDDVVAEVEASIREKVPICTDFSIEVLADDQIKDWPPH